MSLTVESNTQMNTAVDHAQLKSRGKGRSAAHKNSHFSEALDTAVISEAAKDKANAASSDKAAMWGNGQYKNETHALKAALQQLSEETGTPMKGWALGHYRKAFRESGTDDMAAIRDIFNNRHGIHKTGDSGEVPVDPSVDPADPADPDGGPVVTTPEDALASEEQGNLASGNTSDGTGVVTEDGAGTGVVAGDVPLAEENASQYNELFAILDNL